MRTELTMIGNEGFRIVSGKVVIFVDAFYNAMPVMA